MSRLRAVESQEVMMEPPFDQAINQFIDASIQPFYLSDRAWAAVRSGIVAGGLVAVGISAADTFLTEQAVVSPDEASSRMDTEIDDISGQLSRNPDEIQICRSDEVDWCEVTETYNVRQQDGVVRFVKDEISTSELQAKEKAVLNEALPQTSGNRTEEFDASLIRGLQTASETYAVQLVDKVQPTTHPWTGEVGLAGGFALLLAAGLAKWRHRQRKTYKEAYRSLESFTTYSENMNKLKLAAGWEARRGDDYPIPGRLLRQGDFEARNRQRRKVVKAYKELQDQNSQRAS